MITFPYEDKEYKLEFTRETIKAAEKAGLVIDGDKLSDMPNTSVELLYFYAFKAHQPSISKDKVLEICSKMGNKNDFIMALIKESQKPLEALIGEPDEGNAIAWTTE